MSSAGNPGLDELGSSLCGTFTATLPVTGAALSAFSGSRQETTLFASDNLAARLDELQFDLGEGPRWEASLSRRQVLLPDVRSMTHEKWPVFGKALLETDARALFVFPLLVGPVDLGVAELYSSTPGKLSSSDLAFARTTADQAARSLLRHLLLTEPEQDVLGEQPVSRREIHQATGMVSAQTGGNTADALLLLRAHSFASGRSVREVSVDVLARRLTFAPEPKH